MRLLISVLCEFFLNVLYAGTESLYFYHTYLFN